MTLCQLVKAIDDFNGKFGIGGVSDIFFLYGGVNQYARLLGIALTSWQSVMAFNNAEPMLKRLKTATLIRHFRHVKKRAKAKKALTRLRTIANKGK
jgi:hypothetical protein